MHCYLDLPTSRKEVQESLSLLDMKEMSFFLYDNDALNEIIIKTNANFLKEY